MGTQRAKTRLTGEQKYDLWQRLLTGQITTAQAVVVVEAHVDRSTIMTIKKAARYGAIAALSTKPGRPKFDPKERSENQRLQAEIARLQSTVIEQAVEFGGVAGKIGLGLNGPIPARVDGAVKTAILELIMFAVTAGWELSRVCGVLEIDRQRVWRWQQRQTTGTLDDAAPGGRPSTRFWAGKKKPFSSFREMGTCRFLGTVNSRTPRLLPWPGMGFTVNGRPGLGPPWPHTGW